MRKLGLIVLAIAAIGSLSYAQESVDFNIMGTGARARGMGGAFIGVADDATAVGWNPAGLAQLDKPEASLVGLFNLKKFSYEITFPDYPEYDDKWDETANHFAPAFGSLILPTKLADKNLVFAVAYQRMIDMGNVNKDEDYYYDYSTGDTLKYERKIKASGGLDAISPAVAVQLTPQIMVGLAGNILINGYKTEIEETYPDFSSDYRNYTMESSLSGFNMNAGFLGSFNKFNIGAMFRMPFSLKEEPSENEEWDLTSSGWTYNGTATGSYDESYPEVETSMPFMFGFGVAFKPTDKLTLAADFERRPYSSAEASDDSGSYELGYQDCNQFRVGLEYILSGSTAVFPVRLGFRTDPRVYNGWYGDGTDTSQVVGKVFTGGLGLVMGKLMLDFAYELTLANHADVDINDSYFNLTAKANEASHNIMASAIIHF